MELPIFSALLIFVCLTVFVIQYLREDRNSVWIKAVFALLVLLSLFSYSRYGKPHIYGKQARLIHIHDGYHYFMGAKYFEQLGYTKLYLCTYAAFRDLERDGIKVPQIHAIRSLENIREYEMVSLGAAEDARIFAKCKATFNRDRWDEFKADVGVFLSVDRSPAAWHPILNDVGNNSPPSWVVLAGTIAKMFPLSPKTLDLLPFFDLVFVFVLLPILINWAFGPMAAFAFVIVFGNNWLHHFGWTGGSYFRHLWLLLVGAGLCTLHRQKPIIAGALFGAAASTMIFPIFFFIGSLISLTSACWKQNTAENRRSLYYFCASALIVGLILVLGSAVPYGFAAWKEFLSDITVHSKVAFVNTIGYFKYAVFNDSLSNALFPGGPRGIDKFNLLVDCKTQLYRSNIGFHTAFLGLGALCALIIAARVSVVTAAMVCGMIFLNLFTMPSNYYYSFLAFFPAVFIANSHRKENYYRLFGCLVLLALIPLLQVRYFNDLLFNGYVNFSVFVFMQLLTISYLISFCRLDYQSIWGKTEAPAGKLIKARFIGTVLVTLMFYIFTIISLTRWNKNTVHGIPECEKILEISVLPGHKQLMSLPESNGVPLNNRRR